MPREVKSMPVARTLESKMKSFKEALPLINDLKHEALRERYAFIQNVIITVQYEKELSFSRIEQNLNKNSSESELLQNRINTIFDGRLAYQIQLKFCSDSRELFVLFINKFIELYEIHEIQIDIGNN